jgi:phosphoesterase RecJ-like protein
MQAFAKLFSDKICNAGSIAILTHISPDGDAIGSMLAVYHLIRENFGKDAKMFLAGELPLNLEFLPDADKVQIVDANFAPDVPFDLAIVVDTAGTERISGRSVFESAVLTAKIDHHLNHEKFGDIQIVRPDESSAAQIIYDIAVMSSWEISLDAALCLYVGIFTDSGRLTYPRTIPKTFETIAELQRAGVDMPAVVAKLNVRSRNCVLRDARAVAGAKFYFGGRLGVAIVTAADDAKFNTMNEHTAYISGDLRIIDGVQIVAVFHEMQDHIGISLRGSMEFPVNIVAETFNGGGHIPAAGGKVFDTLENAQRIVIAEIGKQIFGE